MQETVNQEETNATVNEEAQQTIERTFTQAEVDTIVGERLKRDRAKVAEEAVKLSTQLDAANKRAAELQTALDAMKEADELRQMRERVAADTGVPASLLNESTEDACREQAARIKEYATPRNYPSVMDGGEIQHITKPTTRQQFADWVNQAFN